MGLTQTVAATLLLASVAGAQSFDEHIAKGRQFFDSQKYDDAVKSFEKAVKVNDKSSDAHLWLARALGNVAAKANILRQPFLAKRLKSEFDKAAQLDPSSVPAHEGLLEFYVQAPGVMGGGMDKARAEAATIAKLSPYRGHFAVVRMANKEKDLAGVEKAWRALYAEFPDSVNAMSNLASFLSNNNRGEEAWPVVEKYHAAHSDDVIAKWWVARTAAITGKQLDRGEKIINELLTIPEDAKGPRVTRDVLRYRLGDIQAKRGDKAKAKAEYEAALKINPKLEQAKQALAALK